jgi:hypothetical protein
MKSCRKRHPKQCKKFKSGDGCRFNESCAYNHLESKSDQKQDELKEIVNNLEKKVLEMTGKNSLESKKVKQLEKVVKAMCRKVLSLESEIENIKKNTKTSEALSEIFEENEIEEENCKINKECLINNSSSDIDENMILSSTPKEMKNVILEKDRNNEWLTCKQCTYKCKKQISLNKHMITKHTEHQCKDCQEKLPTFIELLKHVSKHHFEEQDEVQEEEAEIHKESDYKEVKENVKRSVFVFGGAKQN